MLYKKVKNKPAIEFTMTFYNGSNKNKLYFKTTHNLLVPPTIQVLSFCICNQLNFKHPKCKARFARLAPAEKTAFCRTNPLSSLNGTQCLKDFSDNLLIQIVSH